MSRPIVLAALVTLGACQPPPVSTEVAPSFDTPRRAFLSVTGTPDGEVWIAGARPTPTEGPTLLRGGPEGFEAVQTGQLHDLWWVHALDDGTVYAAGAGATILEIRDGTVERMETPRFFGNTVFGIWGTASDDLWAVGGFAGRDGFIWHYDGETWEPSLLPDDLPRTAGGEIPSMFKVWGRSTDDVWAVGGLGTVLHFDGEAWSVVPTDVQGSLFTVTGNDDEVVIVGERGAGVVLRGGLDGLVDDSPPGVNLLQAVTLDDEGNLWAAGAGGDMVFQPAGGSWGLADVAYEAAPGSIHAMWADPEGEVWAVGGDVLSPELDEGVVLSSLDVTPWVAPEPEPVPTTCPDDRVDIAPDQSIARRWNELLLDSVRRDIPDPPVHARNLYHAGLVMWDVWAAYDPAVDGYLTVEDLEPVADDDVEVALSYGMYRLLTHRYGIAVGAEVSLDCYDRFMDVLGLDPDDTTTTGDGPIALGNRIGQAVIDRYADDGAHEAGGYADTTGWEPTNPVMVVDRPGTNVEDPDVWQQLNLGTAETQNGIVLDDSVQPYLGSHWGSVEPFAIEPDDQGRYGDPLGPYPTVSDEDMVDQVVEVIRKSAELDARDGVMIDIGPGAWGNNSLGADDGTGYDVNPVTGEPYAPNVVPRGDFTRLVAEVWADGPTSETPPGHWVSLGNEVSDELAPEELVPFGRGEPVSRLQWDVGLYFSLGAAAHDAAITAWGMKRDSLGPRPITLIRWMADKGQRTDPSLPSYDPQGLPLVPDLIELITEESSAPGERHHHLRWHVGELAVWGWPGEPGDRIEDYTPLQWMRARDWIPYQRRTFVTPAFPGFISGHSTFSRSAAEMLTAYTGSPWFPGGLHEYVVPAFGFLKFEAGPSTEVRLQWASYYDAADQAGQSRLWGGIHIFDDDWVGRVNGSEAGLAVADKMEDILRPLP